VTQKIAHFNKFCQTQGGCFEDQFDDLHDEVMAAVRETLEDSDPDKLSAAEDDAFFQLELFYHENPPIDAASSTLRTHELMEKFY